jgi:hypothetical protein
MAITRKQAETILLQRVGAWLAATNCTIYDLKPTGINSTLDDPLSFALRQCEIVPADLLKPVNADFAELPDARIDRLLDYGEWRILNTMFQNFVPEDKAAFNNVFANLENALTRKLKHLRDAYGYGLAVEDTMPVAKLYEAAETDDVLVVPNFNDSEWVLVE